MDLFKSELLALFVVTYLQLAFSIPIEDIDNRGAYLDPNCGFDNFQQIVFRDLEDPSNNQTFCSNNDDIQSTPGYARKADYWCICNGVWIIHGIFNGVPSVTGTLASGNIGRICLLYPPEIDIKWTSIRHLAGANLSSSSVSLYRGRYKDEEFHMNGDEVRLPSQIEISSFALTGLQDFTIFEGNNFDGNSECIAAGKNDPFYWGVSFHHETTVTSVGSLRRGCADTAVRTQGSGAMVSIEGDPDLISKIKVEHQQRDCSDPAF